MVLTETPSNPLLRIVDIASISERAKACGALLAVAISLVFLVLAPRLDSDASRAGARVLTAVALLGLLLLPLLCVAVHGDRDRDGDRDGRPPALSPAADELLCLLSFVGGWTAAMALLGLILAGWRGLGVALALGLYTLAICATVGGGIRAAGRRAIVATRAAAALLLLALYAGPFYMKAAIRELDGSPSAIGLVEGASPLAVVPAIWTAAGVPNPPYSIRTGNSLLIYEIWVGTDYQSAMPRWWNVILIWLALATGLWAVAFWRERKRATG